MKINNIKLSKSGKYILTTDEKKYTLHQDVIIKYNLYSKKEIADIDKVIECNNFYDAYYKIIKYINYKLRTEKEIRTKLNSFAISNSDKNKIIEMIKTQGYLNDDTYLKSFINDKINLTNDGPLKIIRELNKLGFKEESINNYLDNYKKNIWIDKINKIINKKIKSNHNYSDIMLKNKINNDLINLGYPKEYFMDILNNQSINDSDILKKEYDKLLNKYLKKYDNEKAIFMTKQKLYQKGFNISNIK